MLRPEAIYYREKLINPSSAHIVTADGGRINDADDSERPYYFNEREALLGLCLAALLRDILPKSSVMKW